MSSYRISPNEIYLELAKLTESLSVKGISAVYSQSPYFTDEQSVEWYSESGIFNTITFWSDDVQGLYLVIRDGITLIKQELSIDEFKLLIRSFA